MKKKKKVLHIMPHASTGGLPQYVYIEIEKTYKLYDTYVVEWDDIAPIYTVQKDLIKQLLPSNHFYSWPQGTNASKKSKELIDIIYSLNPDVVHIEEFPELFLPVPLTQQIYSPDRTYTIIESSHSSGFNPSDKKFLPDAFTFPASIQEERFRYHRIPTTIIEYPIEDHKRPDRTEALKELKLNPKYKHVINVGLFTPGKNQGGAFNIARKLKGNKIQFHFIGNQAMNFKDYWEPLMVNKPENCIVHGERNDVDKWYGACDLLLFPSTAELNPLVPREALSWNMPILMYNLPIYKNAYDLEDNIDFLTDNIDTNCQKVLMKLGASRLSNRNKKIDLPKIKLTHLLTRPNDEREQASIKSLKPLASLGVDYIQHINKPETIYPDIPPITNHEVKRPGYYGAYNAFRRAIEEEFTEDLDFFMICECDCILRVPPEHFVDALSQVCDVVDKENIRYFSFGATGEGEMVWSENLGELSEFSFETNKIILAHCILFPQASRKFLLKQYKELSWDSPDIWLNVAFKGQKMGILNNPLAEQHVGMSLIDEEECKGTIQLYEPSKKDMGSLLDDVYENTVIECRKPLIIADRFNHNFIDGVFFEVKGEAPETKEYENNSYYKNINGFFNFENIYRAMVKEFGSKDSHFVEIGAWKGKSTCFMATEIKNSQKSIAFDTIDTWEGSNSDEGLQKQASEFDIHDEFLISMKNAGIEEFVNDIVMDSVQASELYKDESLDFVFIDGDHTYDAVIGDIKAWYPKVKNGGIIAGHDYNGKDGGVYGVVEAVDEFFGKSNVIIRNTSWLNRKNSDKPISVPTSNEYYMEALDVKNNHIVYSDVFNTNHFITCQRKWFTDWKLSAVKDGKVVYEHRYNAEGKRVLISFESSALGDTIAWIPYVEEFRKKHNCEVYCSTFWNQLYEKEYPDIHFVKPGTKVEGLYDMYRIGHFFPFDPYKNPIDFRTIPLQQTASDILGLEYKEIKTSITLPDKQPKVKDKYVCLSIHSTAQCKYWNNPKGWQQVVNYLTNRGYKVVNIAKDFHYMGNNPPKSVINRTGTKYNIKHRINELQHADLFIGVSSGLAWLSWAIGVPTVLISGTTKPYNEPNLYRVHNDQVCNGCMNDTNIEFDGGKWNWCPHDKQFECSSSITPEMVIEQINIALNIKEQEYWDNPDVWEDKGEEWSKGFGDSKTLWKKTIYPLLMHDYLYNLCGSVLEIAPGQGRITQFLIPHAKDLELVDMSKTCLDSCRHRFSKTKGIVYIKNDGMSLSSVLNASKDLVFSWDSFVHMNLPVISNYVSEIFKKLKIGGIGFIHHANLTDGQEDSFGNIGGRSNMTLDTFKQICQKNNLEVLEQRTIKMNEQITDGITIFRKNAVEETIIDSKMVIITALFNAENYISECIESIKNQSYENFRCYVLDDLSTDDSVKKALKAIDGDSRFSVISNETKMYPIGNHYNTLHREEIDDNDIVITVDGDDYLPDDDVFKRINDVYSKDSNIWLTYGSFNQIQYGELVDGWAKESKNLSNIRNEEWSTTHLRTFRAFLFRGINRRDLIDPETHDFFQMSGDVAMMFPMIGMAGEERVKFLKDINYTYNDDNPISEYKVNRLEQVRIDKYIRSKKPYKKL